MPAGNPWLPLGFSGFPNEPPGLRVHRTYPRHYSPLAGNPRTTARYAMPGSHAMFYAGSTVSVALWETIFRDIATAGNEAEIVPLNLRGMSCVELELVKPLPHFPLAQPFMRTLMTHEGPAWEEIVALCRAKTYEDTHSAARDLAAELGALKCDLPLLSWSSRQDPSGLAYLAYQPPTDESYWRVIGEPVDLDDPVRGHALIRDELARCGMSWRPAATDHTGVRPR